MPSVSVIVPCFNEEQTINELLEAIYLQDFPRRNIEVIIADGMSTDNSRFRIGKFKKKHTGLKLRIVDNPTRVIPAGLNKAIQAATGEYILRLDAHCVPKPNYISLSVRDLERNKGWNVGGVWEIKPPVPGWIAHSIALAAAHPLGVGDAFYRFTARAQEVDTVPFGAFRRSLVQEIGTFDESLQTNEDYEFNTRVRQAGGRVWLNPAIKSIYYSRPTFYSLARQYARYGFWKFRMLRRYPRTLRVRQALPPLFLLSLILFPLFAFLWSWLLWVLYLEMVLYGLLLFGAALREALRQKQMLLTIGIPLAMATMHLSWGAGFLWSVLHPQIISPSAHPNG